MRKKAVFKDRECEVCKKIFTPNGSVQKYCEDCKVVRDIERKRAWYLKKKPDAQSFNRVPILDRKCCICGDDYGLSRFDGKVYCNKHYLRMKNNGTPELVGRKSQNKYEINGEITTLYTTKGEPFYIDTIYLEKVQRYTWCKNASGYLVANANGKILRLHRYILDIDDNSIIVDHINHKKEDNTLNNLRKCTPNENGKNLIIKKNNTSGHPGVRITASNKYNARIYVNGKEIHIGNYDTFEEAVEARLKAELKYFGEFSPNNKKEA